MKTLIGILLGGIPLPSYALLVGVYTAPGDTLSLGEAAGLVATVRDNHTVPTGGRYTVIVSDSSSESSALTSEFSVPEGVSAFFWSDVPYQHAGFEMRGTQALFESGIEKLAELNESGTIDSGVKPVGISPASPTLNALTGATRVNRRVTLHFSLSEPGSVSAEIYALNGRTYGRWKWEESSAGSHLKLLDLDRVPDGTVLVRWSHGDVQVIRRVTGIE